ncbi:hypothetical protein SDC9_174220 [bioreactor metagenome]|uniref:Uncharacterized protein n=1 Tax=bioreactor metagenome TaxID=1076179 RepID=A0A645GJB1_9ZZZZ
MLNAHHAYFQYRVYWYVSLVEFFKQSTADVCNILTVLRTALGKGLINPMHKGCTVILCYVHCLIQVAVSVD